MERRLTVMNLDKLEVRMRPEDFALAIYKEVVPHLPDDENELGFLPDEIYKCMSTHWESIGK